MSHVIGYEVVEDTEEAREQFLSAVCERVEHEDWEEGGSYGGTSSLLNPKRWHRGKVYADRQAAEAAIARMDNGRFDDHAVLFHDVDSLDETKAETSARERIDTLRQKHADYYEAHLLAKRKAAYATCPVCGSRINTSFLGRSYSCPVCATPNAFMSKTVKEGLTRYKERIVDAEERYHALRVKRAEHAPVRWLAKYEYHV